MQNPPADEAARPFFEADLAEDGYVGNCTRLWAWRPGQLGALQGMLRVLSESPTLPLRDRVVLVPTVAQAMGNGYCALAWGAKLAKVNGAAVAAALLQGQTPAELPPRRAALARWARQVVQEPAATTAEDVQALRDAGLGDAEIFDATLYIALRVAYSIVNDALGAQPDAELAAAVPPEVRAAVRYGRAPAGG